MMFLFSSAGDGSMEAKTSKKIHKNVKIEEEITLEDDFVHNKPCNEDIYLNEEKEVETNSFLAKMINNDEIKTIARQEIALEDDFVLHSEDSTSTSRNMSQPLFVEISLASDEIKNAGRQKIALEDDFCRSEDSTNSKICNNPNVKEKIALEKDFSSLGDENTLNKGKPLGRQMSSDDVHYEKLNDAPSPRLNVDYPSTNEYNGLQSQNKKSEMKYTKEDVINDPDYELNTMSDVR